MRGTTLAAYLQGAIDRHYEGVALKLSTRIGISAAAWSRGIDRNRFGVATCLKLAYELGDHPSVILRLAGHGECADVLDELFPDPEGPRFSRREREFLTLLRLLPTTGRSAIVKMVAELAR